MNNRSPFFSELKRRNVIREAILYVGAVWILAQGIYPALHELSLHIRVTSGL